MSGNLLTKNGTKSFSKVIHVKSKEQEHFDNTNRIDKLTDKKVMFATQQIRERERNSIAAK